MVGMKNIRNVRYNLECIATEPLTREEWFDVLKPGRRQEYIEDDLEMD